MFLFPVEYSITLFHIVELVSFWQFNISPCSSCLSNLLSANDFRNTAIKSRAFLGIFPAGFSRDSGRDSGLSRCSVINTKSRSRTHACRANYCIPFVPAQKCECRSRTSQSRANTKILSPHKHFPHDSGYPESREQRKNVESRRNVNANHPRDYNQGTYNRQVPSSILDSVCLFLSTRSCFFAKTNICAHTVNLV